MILKKIENHFKSSFRLQHVLTEASSSSSSSAHLSAQAEKEEPHLPPSSWFTEGEPESRFQNKSSQLFPPFLKVQVQSCCRGCRKNTKYEMLTLLESFNLR